MINQGAASTLTQQKQKQETEKEEDTVTVFRLQEEKKVSFAEDVVDNEFAGKKKSKACCIYHKPHKNAQDSSDYSSSDGEGPNAYQRIPKYKKDKK